MADILFHETNPLYCTITKLLAARIKTENRLPSLPIHLAPRLLGNASRFALSFAAVRPSHQAQLELILLSTFGPTSSLSTCSWPRVSPRASTSLCSSGLPGQPRDQPRFHFVSHLGCLTFRLPPRCFYFRSFPLTQLYFRFFWPWEPTYTSATVTTLIQTKNT